MQTCPACNATCDPSYMVTPYQVKGKNPRANAENRVLLRAICRECADTLKKGNRIDGYLNREGERQAADPSEA